ncbi:hypothetical protein [Vibrio sp. WXL210]|uniref:hypothetical protein n=1 Tax=Vibrio sp. WXL210 TaxID=3450709 RepID=UPI003EC8E989
MAIVLTDDILRETPEAVAGEVVRADLGHLPTIMGTIRAWLGDETYKIDAKQLQIDAVDSLRESARIRGYNAITGVTMDVRRNFFGGGVFVSARAQAWIV